jgi:hypothetical protein
MALTDQQMQFANAGTLATPGLDQATKNLGAGLQGFMDTLIHEQIGGIMDETCSNIRGMGKKCVIDIASNKLAEGKNHAPDLTPSSSPDISQKGNSTEIAKSMVPEKVIAQAQSIGNAGGLAVEHVAEANIGTLAPAYTPSMGAGRSQGMAIG